MRCKQKQKPKDAITYCRKVGYVVTSTVKSVIKKGIINKTKVSGHGKGLKSRDQMQVNQWFDCLSKLFGFCAESNLISYMSRHYVNGSLVIL